MHSASCHDVAPCRAAADCPAANTSVGHMAWQNRHVTWLPSYSSAVALIRVSSAAYNRVRCLSVTLGKLDFLSGNPAFDVDRKAERIALQPCDELVFERLI